MNNKKRTIRGLAIAILLAISITTPAHANPITNWLFGTGVKNYAESTGHTCAPKPWYVPLPAHIWYDLTCAKKAS